LTQTLRSVTANANTVVAVGADAVVLTLDRTDPNGVWTQPECFPTPAPLDERPVMAAVTESQGVFHAVGSAGVVVRIDAGTACGLTPRAGSPQAFLSGVFALAGDQAFGVGDQGVVIEIDANAATQLTTGLNPTYQGIGMTPRVDGTYRMWLVGASGAMATGDYY
jgi:hypothetical protein